MTEILQKLIRQTVAATSINPLLVQQVMRVAKRVKGGGRGWGEAGGGRVS